LAVVFEKLVEQCVGDEWFHWDVLVLLMGHISGKHLHKNYDTPPSVTLCDLRGSAVNLFSSAPSAHPRLITSSTQNPLPQCPQ